MTRICVNAEREDFPIEVFDDIGAVQTAWQQLESEGLLTPFQSQAWLLPFYDILAPAMKAAPVLVLVRDKASRRPVMLLPLCRHRQWWMTIIEFADLGVSDYNAPLLAPDFNPTAAQWQDLWRRLLRALNGGTVLRFRKMPHHIGGRVNPFVQYGKTKVMDLAAWGVSLPSTAAEYNARSLNPTFARELARKFRRVAKRGAMEYAVAQTPDEKQNAFDVLARQRQARCDEMGRSNILAHPACRAFYEAVTVKSPEKLGSLGTLKVGGETVAAVLALNYRNAMHVLMSTFEGGDWKSSSLGNVAIQSSIDHSIGAGIGFFDFTIGNENYKQYFGASPVPLYSGLYPLTPAGRMTVVMMTGLRLVKNAIKGVRSTLLNRLGKNVQAESVPY